MCEIIGRNAVAEHPNIIGDTPEAILTRTLRERPNHGVVHEESGEFNAAEYGLRVTEIAEGRNGGASQETGGREEAAREASNDEVRVGLLEVGGPREGVEGLREGRVVEEGERPDRSFIPRHANSMSRSTSETSRRTHEEHELNTTASREKKKKR